MFIKNVKLSVCNYVQVCQVLLQVNELRVLQNQMVFHSPFLAMRKYCHNDVSDASSLMDSQY